MTRKFSLKAVCAAALVALASSANAGPFYLDIGTNYHAAGLNKVNATSTSVKNEFTLQYQSVTTVTDVGGINGPTVGDTTSTTAGVALAANLAALWSFDPVNHLNSVGSALYNNITNFAPAQAGNFASNNGYGQDWMIGFGIENLTGTISGFGTGPEITYNAGSVLKFYVWEGAAIGTTAGTNFMNINITGGASGTGGTTLLGQVDFTGIELNSYRHLFRSANPGTFGSSFFDLWNSSTPPGELAISFDSDFNTDTNPPPAIVPIGPGQYQIGPAKHDGSATFDIPAPGVLALTGLALVGAGALSRRRREVKEEVAA